MIVRILGEGQLDVPDEEIDALNSLDAHVEACVNDADEEGFRSALEALLAAVRDAGSAVPDEDLVESDLILPPGDATLDEVKELLGDEGLIPG